MGALRLGGRCRARATSEEQSRDGLKSPDLISERDSIRPISHLLCSLGPPVAYVTPDARFSVSNIGDEGSMKLLRLQEVGGIDTYINQEQVTFIQAHGDAETEVWFSNGKKLDIAEPVAVVARLIMGGAVHTTVPR
jgi:hypothetical protein